MNTPKGPSVLDQWEAEAESSLKIDSKDYKLNSLLGFFLNDSPQKRILALIDLVRKKDEALIYCAFKGHSDSKTECAHCIAQEALALTEELK